MVGDVFCGMLDSNYGGSFALKPLVKILLQARTVHSSRAYMFALDFGEGPEKWNNLSIKVC